MAAGIIGIGANLLGGLFGSNNASKAGSVLSAAGSNAANAINSTAAGANAGLGTAANGAENTVSAATGAGQHDISSAVTGAQNTVSAATAGAQNQMANQMNQISPYQAAGQQGINSLAAGLGANGQFTNALNTQFSFNPSDLQNTPGYQFQLQQGLQANKNAMTASGLGNSGAAMKGANNYATGLAGTYYQNAYNNALSSYQTNRQNTLYQMGALQNLAGIGQNANQQAMAGAEYIGNAGMQGSQYIGNAGMSGANSIAGLGMQGAQSIAGIGMNTALQQGNWSNQAMQAAMGDYMQGQGGKAAGIMGAGNSWMNALGGISNGLMQMSGMGGMGGGGYGGGWGSNATYAGGSPWGSQGQNMWTDPGNQLGSNNSPLGSITTPAGPAYDINQPSTNNLNNLTNPEGGG